MTIEERIVNVTTEIEEIEARMKKDKETLASKKKTLKKLNGLQDAFNKIFAEDDEEDVCEEVAC